MGLTTASVPEVGSGHVRQQLADPEGGVDAGQDRAGGHSRRRSANQLPRVEQQRQPHSQLPAGGARGGAGRPGGGARHELRRVPRLVVRLRQARSGDPTAELAADSARAGRTHGGRVAHGGGVRAGVRRARRRAGRGGGRRRALHSPRRADGRKRRGIRRSSGVRRQRAAGGGSRPGTTRGLSATPAAPRASPRARC